MAKRRNMLAFKINEISGVDNPAQVGARAVLMKRATPVDRDDLVKRGKAALTTAVDDHTHLVSLENYDGFPVVSGTTSYDTGNASTGKGYSHSHPWIMLDDGTVLIGEADNHTHEIAAVSKAAMHGLGIALADGRYPVRDARDLRNAVKAFEKTPPAERSAIAAHIVKRARDLKIADQLPPSGELADLAKLAQPNGDPDMRIQQAATLEAANANVSLLTKAVAALMSMSQAQHAHLAKLDGEDAKDAYIAKTSDVRETEAQNAITKAAESNPVAYTATDGTIYRKNDDPRMVALAKQADADRAELKKAQKSNEDAEFGKRAARELGHLPGTEVVKVAVLRAIEKGEPITDAATLEGARALLKAGDAAMVLAETFKRRGSGGGGNTDPADPTAQLDALAKKHAADNKVEFAKAYDAILQTDEGRALYSKMIASAAPAATQH